LLLDDQFHVVFDVFVSWYHDVDDAHFQMILHLDMNLLINVTLVHVYNQNPFYYYWENKWNYIMKKM
jgi:hypothetical protein